jgi:HSP20 family molecular chaperone IbpA
MFIFDEFDKIIQKEFQSIFRMLQNTTPSEDPNSQLHIEEKDGSHTIRWGPIVYGRMTTVDPDGQVQTREWSNLSEEARQKFFEQLKDMQLPIFFPPQPTRPSPLPQPQPPNRPFPGPQPQPKLKDVDEYPIDIVDTKDGYLTIFDTNATVKEEIAVKTEGRLLKLWVRGQIFRELELPTPVELESLRFKNGVVEVHLRSNKGSKEVVQGSKPEEQAKE